MCIKKLQLQERENRPEIILRDSLGGGSNETKKRLRDTALKFLKIKIRINLHIGTGRLREAGAAEDLYFSSPEIGQSTEGDRQPSQWGWVVTNDAGLDMGSL